MSGIPSPSLQAAIVRRAELSLSVFERRLELCALNRDGAESDIAQLKISKKPIPVELLSRHALEASRCKCLTAIIAMFAPLQVIGKLKARVDAAANAGKAPPPLTLGRYQRLISYGEILLGTVPVFEGVLDMRRGNDSTVLANVPSTIPIAAALFRWLCAKDGLAQKDAEKALRDGIRLVQAEAQSVLSGDFALTEGKARVALAMKRREEADERYHRARINANETEAAIRRCIGLFGDIARDPHHYIYIWH